MIEEVKLAGDVVLRPVTEHDARPLLDAYLRNRDHLRRWEPRRPEEFFTERGQTRRLTSLLEQQAAGQAVAWVLAEGESVVGRMTLSNIVRGPWLSGDLGYWTDAGHTGRGLS
ncbi:GNAT family N-acetyltransferase, partial [Nonomuraea fuscirosea]